MCSCDYQTPRDYNQPLHTKKRTGQWAILKFGPPWLTMGVGITRSINPHKEAFTCCEHHSFKTPHRALILTNLRQGFPHKVLLVQHALQSYELNNWIIEYFAAAFAPTLLWLAVTGLWFCTDRFVTLPSQTWLCNHRFGLAVLVQSWISKENNWSIDIKKTFWKNDLGELTQGTPHDPVSPQIIGKVLP